MTPFQWTILGGQACGWACSTTRSVSGCTKTIRSRIGSRGRVMTSTMTIPLSRRSVTPPRAPAGARSAASVSSTTSPIARSSIVATPPSVGLGVGSDQSRRGLCVSVVPCGEDERSSVVDSQHDKDAVARGASLSAQSSDWSPSHRLSDRFPNEFCVLSLNLEDTPPFIGVSFDPKNPIDQLGSRAPGIFGSWKGLSNFWRPGHNADARRRRRACVQHRQILRASSHTKVGRAR